MVPFKAVFASLIGVAAAVDIDCTVAACPDQCSCALNKCRSEIDACLAVDECARAQACALACPCSDNACISKCAESAPPTQALPAATCINSECSASKPEEADNPQVYYYRKSNAQLKGKVGDCKFWLWRGAGDRSHPGVNAESKPQIKRWVCSGSNLVPDWLVIFDAIHVVTSGKARMGVRHVGSDPEYFDLGTRDSLYIKGGMIGSIEKQGDEDLEFVVQYASANYDVTPEYRTYKRGIDAPLQKSPFVHEEDTCDKVEPGPTGTNVYSGVWNHTFNVVDNTPVVLGVMFNPTCAVAKHYHPSGATYINTNGTFTIHNDGGADGDSNDIDSGEIRWVGKNYEYGPEISTHSQKQVDIIVVGNSISPVFTQDTANCQVLGEADSCLVPGSVVA